MLNEQLKNLQSRVSKEHKDIAKFAQHLFDEMDARAELHRLEVATQATAGVKPDGKEEKAYYDKITEMKKLVLQVLEKTTQDFEHQGDKRWEKNFKDGVNE